MNNIKVSIIILNYNSWNDTLKCLDSLLRINYKNVELSIADNGSHDDSVNKILEWGILNKKNIGLFKEEEEKCKNISEGKASEINLFLNSKNYGFAKGNNLIIQKIIKEDSSKYILLLNNDTIVDPMFLDGLVNTIETNDRIAAISPTVFYSNYKNSNEYIVCCGSKLNTFFGFVTHNYNKKKNINIPKILYNNFLEGSALLIKSSVLKNEGLFDERFFLYVEDVDLSYRLFKKGYLLASTSESKIWHKIMSSSPKSEKNYFLVRNTIWFMRKHNSKIRFRLFLIFFCVIGIPYMILFKSDHKKTSIKRIFDGLKEGINTI